MAETTYIVLLYNGRIDDGSGAWTVKNKHVPAASAEEAIRHVCKNDGTPAGTYVAVPQRSWKPVTVTAVQTTVLTLNTPAEPT